MIAFNGATGVLYHCSFPVLARASWGFRGSYVPIISRVILALFWFAIHTMNGANAVRALITAMAPGFMSVPNGIPPEQGVASNQMISFFIFWCIQLPFLYMRPNTLRWLFVAKAIYVPVVWVAILIWAFASTGGGRDMFHMDATVSGADYDWKWLTTMTSNLGSYATLSVNQVCEGLPLVACSIPAA